MSSLILEVSLWDIARRNGGRFEYGYYDENWYDQEVNKAVGYRPGPVAVIKFNDLAQ